MANFFKRDERDDLVDAKNALHSEELAKQKRIEQLAKVGQVNLKEAAIVFSTEGFGLFVNMLCNSVDRIIEERVSQIIEEKMLDVMDGMKIGMQRSMESMGDQVLQRFGLAPKQEGKQIQFDLETSESVQTYTNVYTKPVDSVQIPQEQQELSTTVEPEPEVVTVAGNLPDTEPTFELSTEGQSVIEKLNDILDRKTKIDNNVKLEVVSPEPKNVRHAIGRRRIESGMYEDGNLVVGCKVSELRQWAPIFADVVKSKAPKRITRKDIVDEITKTHPVKFMNPTHVANTMLELYPEITRPEKGIYQYNKH